MKLKVFEAANATSRTTVAVDKNGHLKRSRVTGVFKIEQRAITSLEGLFPNVVDGGIVITRTNVDSLKGCPEHVKGNFQFTVGEITNLVGGPKRVDGNYWVGNNEKLVSLEGAPEYVGGNCMMLWNHQLVDLHNIHKMMPEIHGELTFGNTVRHNVLGVLLIKGVTRFSGTGETKVDNIISKYLPNKRGMLAVLECQEELIEAGKESYAHL